jgi:hypothetical protein
MRASPQLIVLFVLSLLAAPLAAEAQQPGKLPRIGAHLDLDDAAVPLAGGCRSGADERDPGRGELREFPAAGGLRALSLELVINLKTAKALGLTLG